ncbi:putative transposase [Staphylococcus aureus]|uniref:Putative transposase n=3 Tax=Staphylococcus aureus TaxID=1280 RepID=A0A380DKZ5_STAAU|nr:putative transposase [Staphylococcus aureus]SUK35361.1 putative transposase [Staphylococcus aureus]
MMLKIILYAYTQSVFSGRRIEKLLHDSIRMMWLAQNQTPSYKTINRFRVNPNTDALIESLFIQFHSQCLKQNLIDDNSIFIDGTKVEASAIGFVLMALNIRKIAAQRAVHYKIHIKKADFYQIINRNQLFYIA